MPLYKTLPTEINAVDVIIVGGEYGMSKRALIPNRDLTVSRWDSWMHCGFKAV
jgi:hypothetical protein